MSLIKETNWKSVKELEKIFYIFLCFILILLTGCHKDVTQTATFLVSTNDTISVTLTNTTQSPYKLEAAGEGFIVTDKGKSHFIGEFLTQDGYKIYEDQALSQKHEEILDNNENTGYVFNISKDTDTPMYVLWIKNSNTGLFLYSPTTAGRSREIYPLLDIEEYSE